MKRFWILIAALLISNFAGADCDSPLIGAWQSDTQLTIGSIESVRALSDEERQNYEETLGKMTMTFACAQVTVDWGMEGSKETVAPYAQIDASESHVTVEFLDQEGNRRETVRYELDGPCIRRRLHPEGWHEYFCRVPEREDSTGE